MHIDRKNRRVYFRVPGSGSTSFLNVHQYSLKGGSDHGLRRDVDWTRGENAPRQDWVTVVVLRNPYAWLRTMWTMCHRAVPHWTEYVAAGCKHRSSQLAFVENLKYTLFDWSRDPDGSLPKHEVLMVEELEGLSQMNQTKQECLEPWNPTDEIKAVIDERFALELKYYNK